MTLKKTKGKRGRPAMRPGEARVFDQIAMRVTPEQYAALNRAAGNVGEDISTYVRRVALLAHPDTAPLAGDIKPSFARRDLPSMAPSKDA